MTLAAQMRDGDVRLEPMFEGHREAMRAACAADTEIWEIYPYRLLGEDFDRSFDSMFGNPAYITFAVFDGERLVGMTGFLAIDQANLTLEIGRTYIVPDVRGTGFNRRMKMLMLDRAFGENFVRVSFRVDTRNQRSMAAVRKLGATYEGTLRKDRVTWTGYQRDTAIFSILADEWAELRK